MRAIARACTPAMSVVMSVATAGLLFASASNAQTPQPSDAPARSTRPPRR